MNLERKAGWRTNRDRTEIRGVADEIEGENDDIAGKNEARATNLKALNTGGFSIVTTSFHIWRNEGNEIKTTGKNRGMALHDSVFGPLNSMPSLLLFPFSVAPRTPP